MDGILGGSNTNAGPANTASKEPPVALICGVMPSGAGLHDFHAPPLKVHARTAEGAYWRGFGDQVATVFPATNSDDVLGVTGNAWGVAAGAASEACARQSLFFQALDRYDSRAEDPTLRCEPKQKSDPYDAALAAAMQKLSCPYVKSPTVVMEAAFFLLQKGLLNVPDLGCINVKQARAFLLNFAWLQEYMNKIWEEDPSSLQVCLALKPGLRSRIYV